MTDISQEHRDQDRAGRAAIKLLAAHIKGRTVLAQLFTILSALLAFVPYLALVRLGETFIAAQQGMRPLDADQVSDIVMLLVTAFVLRLTFYLLSLTITHFADMRLRFVIRRKIVERLSRVPLAWFGRTGSGRIRNAVQDDTKTVHTVIAHAPVDMLNGILTPLVLLAFMFVMNWRLALVGIATLPFYFVLYGSSMKDMGPKTAEMNNNLANVSATMVELVSGIKVIKAFGKSGESYRNYAEAARAFADSYWEWCAPMIGRCAVAAEFVSIPVLLLVNLGGGALLHAMGLATLPQIIACTLIALVLPNAMMSVANITWSYQLAGSAAVRLVELMDTPPLEEPEHPHEPDGRPRVVIRDVSYSYGETQALRGVDLTLEPGTVTALIGPSGSGKSTLATLVARFDDPSQGSIELGGVALRSLSPDVLYRNVSFVLQDAMLLNASIARNVSLPRPEASLEQIRDAARAAQIDDFVMSLPKGYGSVIGTDCELSGGEAQRLSIARAILADAPVLVMDEATAFADPDSEVEIQRALGGLVEGRTVLVIAHRLNSVVGAHQIAVMEEGRIAALGTHETLLDNDHYRALLAQGGFAPTSSAKEGQGDCHE
nr:ABC transporter ATP-binding protein [uncultured Olsenella sp.]